MGSLSESDPLPDQTDTATVFQVRGPSDLCPSLPIQVRDPSSQLRSRFSQVRNTPSQTGNQSMGNPPSQVEDPYSLCYLLAEKMRDFPSQVKVPTSEVEDPSSQMESPSQVQSPFLHVQNPKLCYPLPGQVKGPSQVRYPSWLSYPLSGQTNDSSPGCHLSDQMEEPDSPFHQLPGQVRDASPQVGDPSRYHLLPYQVFNLPSPSHYIPDPKEGSSSPIPCLPERVRDPSSLSGHLPGKAGACEAPAAADTPLHLNGDEVIFTDCVTVGQEDAPPNHDEQVDNSEDCGHDARMRSGAASAALHLKGKQNIFTDSVSLCQESAPSNHNEQAENLEDFVRDGPGKALRLEGLRTEMSPDLSHQHYQGVHGAPTAAETMLHLNGRQTTITNRVSTYQKNELPNLKEQVENSEDSVENSKDSVLHGRGDSFERRDLSSDTSPKRRYQSRVARADLSQEASPKMHYQGHLESTDQWNNASAHYESQAKSCTEQYESFAKRFAEQSEGFAKRFAEQNEGDTKIPLPPTILDRSQTGSVEEIPTLTHPVTPPSYPHLSPSHHPPLPPPPSNQPTPPPSHTDWISHPVNGISTNTESRPHPINEMLDTECISHPLNGTSSHIEPISHPVTRMLPDTQPISHPVNRISSDTVWILNPENRLPSQTERITSPVNGTSAYTEQISDPVNGMSSDTVWISNPENRIPSHSKQISDPVNGMSSDTVWISNPENRIPSHSKQISDQVNRTPPGTELASNPINRMSKHTGFICNPATSTPDQAEDGLVKSLQKSEQSPWDVEYPLDLRYKPDVDNLKDTEGLTGVDMPNGMDKPPGMYQSRWHMEYLLDLQHKPDVIKSNGVERHHGTDNQNGMDTSQWDVEYPLDLRCKPVVSKSKDIDDHNDVDKSNDTYNLSGLDNDMSKSHDKEFPLDLRCKPDMEKSNGTDKSNDPYNCFGMDNDKDKSNDKEFPFDLRSKSEVDTSNDMDKSNNMDKSNGMDNRNAMSKSNGTDKSNDTYNLSGMNNDMDTSTGKEYPLVLRGKSDAYLSNGMDKSDGMDHDTDKSNGVDKSNSTAKSNSLCNAMDKSNYTDNSNGIDNDKLNIMDKQQGMDHGMDIPNDMDKSSVEAPGTENQYSAKRKAVGSLLKSFSQFCTVRKHRKSSAGFCDNLDDDSNLNTPSSIASSTHTPSYQAVPSESLQNTASSVSNSRLMSHGGSNGIIHSSENGTVNGKNYGQKPGLENDDGDVRMESLLFHPEDQVVFLHGTDESNGMDNDTGKLKSVDKQHLQPETEQGASELSDTMCLLGETSDQIVFPEDRSQHLPKADSEPDHQQFDALRAAAAVNDSVFVSSEDWELFCTKDTQEDSVFVSDIRHETHNSDTCSSFEWKETHHETHAPEIRPSEESRCRRPSLPLRRPRMRSLSYLSNEEAKKVLDEQFRMAAELNYMRYGRNPSGDISSTDSRSDHLSQQDSATDYNFNHQETVVANRQLKRQAPVVAKSSPQDADVADSRSNHANCHRLSLLREGCVRGNEFFTSSFNSSTCLSDSLCNSSTKFTDLKPTPLLESISLESVSLTNISCITECMSGRHNFNDRFFSFRNNDTSHSPSFSDMESVVDTDVASDCVFDESPPKDTHNTGTKEKEAKHCNNETYTVQKNQDLPVCKHSTVVHHDPKSWNVDQCESTAKDETNPTSCPSSQEKSQNVDQETSLHCKHCPSSVLHSDTSLRCVTTHTQLADGDTKMTQSITTSSASHHEQPQDANIEFNNSSTLACSRFVEDTNKNTVEEQRLCNGGNDNDKNSGGNDNDKNSHLSEGSVLNTTEQLLWNENESREAGTHSEDCSGTCATVWNGDESHEAGIHSTDCSTTNTKDLRKQFHLNSHLHSVLGCEDWFHVQAEMEDISSVTRTDDSAEDNERSEEAECHVCPVTPQENTDKMLSLKEDAELTMEGKPEETECSNSPVNPHRQTEQIPSLNETAGLIRSGEIFKTKETEIPFMSESPATIDTWDCPATAEKLHTITDRDSPASNRLNRQTKEMTHLTPHMQCLNMTSTKDTQTPPSQPHSDALEGTPLSHNSSPHTANSSSLWLADTSDDGFSQSLEWDDFCERAAQPLVSVQTGFGDTQSYNHQPLNVTQPSKGSVVDLLKTPAGILTGIPTDIPAFRQLLRLHVNHSDSTPSGDWEENARYQKDTEETSGTDFQDGGREFETVSENSQTGSDALETGSDANQTGSDASWTGSDANQTGSDAKQADSKDCQPENEHSLLRRGHSGNKGSDNDGDSDGNNDSNDDDNGSDNDSNGGNDGDVDDDGDSDSDDDDSGVIMTIMTIMWVLAIMTLIIVMTSPTLGIMKVIYFLVFMAGLYLIYI